MAESIFQRVAATMLGEALSWCDFSDAWDSLPQNVRDGVLRDMAQTLEKRVADFSADASLREQVRALEAKRKEDAEMYLADVNAANAGKDELREQVRTLTAQVEDWKSATMLDVGGDPDGVTPDMLRADIAKRDAEVRTLTADNAALVNGTAEAERMLECGSDRFEVETHLGGLRMQPHPGAALLAEMDALRSENARLKVDLESTRNGMDAEDTRANRAEADAEAFRARVAELEAYRDQCGEETFALLKALGHVPGENPADTARRVVSERDGAQQRAKALEEAVGSIIFAVRRGLALKDWDGSLFAARSEWQAIDDAFPKETK